MRENNADIGWTYASSTGEGGLSVNAQGHKKHGTQEGDEVELHVGDFLLRYFAEEYKM